MVSPSSRHLHPAPTGAYIVLDISRLPLGADAPQPRDPARDRRLVRRRALCHLQPVWLAAGEEDVVGGVASCGTYSAIIRRG